MIQVTKREQVATLRQVITPQSQDDVVAMVAELVSEYRKHRITGPTTIHFRLGGVRNIVTEQTAAVPIGSEVDRAMEKFFQK